MSYLYRYLLNLFLSPCCFCCFPCVWTLRSIHAISQMSPAFLTQVPWVDIIPFRLSYSPQFALLMSVYHTYQQPLFSRMLLLKKQEESVFYLLPQDFSVLPVGAPPGLVTSACIVLYLPAAPFSM